MGRHKYLLVFQVFLELFLLVLSYLLYIRFERYETELPRLEKLFALRHYSFLKVKFFTLLLPRYVLWIDFLAKSKCLVREQKFADFREHGL